MDYDLWHRRLGHLNLASLKQMHTQNRAQGLAITSNAAPDPICEPCLAGKMHANPFPSSTIKLKRPLALVHSNLKGPLPRTHSGHRYWITFTDDQTRFKACVPLKLVGDQ